MSMTREEAIEYAESKKMRLEALVYNDDCKYGNYAMYSDELSFVNAALSALRPVSRKRVEQIKGVWIFNDNWWEFRCSECHKGIGNIEKYKFCPHCGAPMTDDAVQMVMERLEMMKNEIP